jgi:uncharacterized repeat protein (TIGR03803 family)
MRMPQQSARYRAALLVCLCGLTACDPDLFGSDSADRAPPTYTVGGTVAGLTSGKSVSLLDNNGDALPVSANGTFNFKTALASSSSYSITVGTQPSGQTCTVSGGSGTIASVNVANAVVTCSDEAFTLGGSIQGLNGSGLVLANGSDTVTVSSGDSAFTLSTAVAYTSAYTVTVQTQPSGLACSVSNGSGTMPAANVTSVAVTCTDQPFTLGGSIAGLGNHSGLVLANGTDSLNVVANSSTFTMPSRVNFGSAYAVTVQAAPSGLTCTVTQSSGSMPASDVSSVVVTCSDRAYTLGGSIVGLGNHSGLVLANGTDTLNVVANSTSFTLPTPVAYTSPYAVTVQSQPSGSSCNVSSGAGTMPGADLNNVVVSCTPTYTIGGSITGLGSHPGLVLVNGSDTLHVLANAMTFTMSTGATGGSTYNVVVQTTPMITNCTVTNGSGTVGSANINNVNINCVPGTESVLYSFQGSPTDSEEPDDGNALLQANDGNLYGVTYGGGANGAGTVFTITPAGVETVLWSFGSGSDGQNPYGRLIQAADGNFYGTTHSGGANNMGTVFEITPAGVETLLWSFGTGADGKYPYGGLVQATDGNFYGTTEGGGTHSRGAVFKITPSRVETVLWSFGSGTDGQVPWGGLIQAVDGDFYGTTGIGGTSNAGTVFKITPAGVETVLWSFGSGSDGQLPYGSLLQASDGNFYGMANEGGTSNVGTVFKVTPAGVETVLWSFGSGTDGQLPFGGGLIEGTDGNFYGLTSTGGTNNSGTVFQITPMGAETVLWSFGNSGDGQNPYGSLLLGKNGFLYGLANGGATGHGVVFQIN